jgi:ABC-type transport system substrate-binding protein
VPFYPEDVSRIYIADDVAMNTDGVPLDPKLREAGKYLTDQVRDLIRSNKENLAMRGAGFIVAPMSYDGKQHIYAKITLGRLSRGLLSSAIEDKIGGNDERFDKIILQGSDLDDQLKQLKDKVLYFDTGISTLGLNSLSLDEALDAMSGSIALDKKWGVSKNTLYNNPEFINQSDPFAYDMDELIEELDDEVDQETIERILNGTYGQ